MPTININHVTRIEGHASITIHLDDAGKVTDTQFHVTQIRGFEKFVEGRPYYEMPAITSRICGICPVSHLLAASKACDAIMAVRIPRTAAKLRELMHMAQIVQSHALSFFHLSAPDLLLGMDSDPAKRNVAGLLAEHPAVVLDGVKLRKFGQQVIERLGKERIHPSWTVPGGVNAELDPRAREKTLEEWPEALAILQRTLKLWKGTLDAFPEEIAAFSNFPTMYCGLVGPDGSLQLYDGNLRFRGADGEIVVDQVEPADYKQYIGEATMPDSYLKAPYFKPLGLEDGIYRVGPLARLNVCDHISTPLANAELQEMRGRLGRVVQSSFHNHYARLIEALYCMERMKELLEDPRILETKVRAHAGVNDLEGVGIIEAPRGTLIHDYRVDDNGAMTWANLIVATGHNNLAIRRGAHQVAQAFIDGNHIQEGAVNRVSALVRAFDPCLSCSTHTLGMAAVKLELRGPKGELLDEAGTV
ncbi:MAG: Ni/Fe hydrogenase subunit alpha [Chloroflexota bacterium]|nr:Ni/Fe hydrogenase subunit alpha [Chloroflexota bacterium]